MMKFLTKKVKLALTGLLTVILVLFLFTQISFFEVIYTLKNLNLIWVLVGFLFYSLSFLFRAVRFKILLKDNLSVKELFKVVSIHTMWNDLLPLRTGEFSYLFLLKKRGFAKTKALASLMVARISDFFMIIFVFFTAYFFAGTLSGLIKGFVNLFILLALFLIAFQIGFLFYGKRFLKLIQKLLVFLNLANKKSSKIFLEHLDVLLNSFKSMHNKKLPLVFIITLLVWFSQYLVAFSLIFAMGVSLSSTSIVLGMTFVFLVAALPIHGFGSFGTFEAAWAAVFSALGLTLSVAISSAFAYHIVLFVFFLTLGLPAWILEIKN